MGTKQTIEISTGTIFRVIVIILALVAIYYIRDVIAIVFFAIIVASAVAPVARWFEKLRFPRVVGVLLVYIIVIGIIVFLISLLIPSLASQVKDFSAAFPQYAEKFYSSFRTLEDISSKYYDVVGQIEKFLGELGDILKRSAADPFGTTVNVFGGLLAIIAVIVISFYLSVNKKGVQGFLESIIPNQHRTYILDLWERVQRKVGRWLQGQLLLGIIVGVAVYIGLSLLGVPFAPLLAIIAGIFELLPYVGPVLAAVPAVVLALFQSPLLALWVVILYIVVQQLENNILVPNLMGRVVGLNPLVVIIALLIGGKIAGIVGVILAVPIAAIIAEFIKDFRGKR